jgi:hypothetical protein
MTDETLARARALAELKDKSATLLDFVAAIEQPLQQQIEMLEKELRESWQLEQILRDGAGAAHAAR